MTTHTNDHDGDDVGNDHGRSARLIHIFVNGKEVTVTAAELTGLQIKQAAMAQGVNIQADFVLFEDLNNGKQVIVKDQQVVKLREHQRFEAITNDDNS